MYKSEISDALGKIALTSGGAISGLIRVVSSVEDKIDGLLREVAKNNDASVRSGANQLQEVVKQISRQISEISPLRTAVELHDVSVRFDEVLTEFPELEPLLRSGRQALAELSGAYDAVLQQHSRAPAVVDLIRPATSLGRDMEHYSALAKLLKGTDKDELAGTATYIEIQGGDRLRTFAAYVAWLSSLADIAGQLVNQSSLDEPPPAEVSIASIESGSPIKITLKGDLRVLRLVAAMIRDVLRVPYLNFTTHGRLIQSMETFALAKEFGVDSPEVLETLAEAMTEASRQYRDSIRAEAADVVVDGAQITESATQALPPPDADATDGHREVPRLPRPKN